MYKNVSANFKFFNYPSLDDYLAPFVEYHTFSGIVGAYDFSSNFHQIYSSNPAQYSQDTFFRIASLSKPFLAMIVLKNFDDLHVKLSPEMFGLNGEYWPRFWSNITINDLLSHCSGIPDCFNPNFSELYSFIKGFENYQYFTNILSDELLFSKDNHGVYNYSNSNYFLLTRLLEFHKKQPYHKILNEFLIALDMLNSGLLVKEENASSSNPFDGSSGGFWDEINRENRQLEISFKHGGGAAGMFSTLEDMAKFSKELYMLANGRNCKLSELGFTQCLLNDQILKNYCDLNLDDDKYGLGFRLFKCGGFGHGGMFNGFRAKFIMNKDGQCVIEMQNRVNSFPKIADAIYYHMFLNNRDCIFPSFKSEQNILSQTLLKFLKEPKEYLNLTGIYGIHSYKLHAKNSKLIVTKYLIQDYPQNFCDFEIKLIKGEGDKYIRDFRPEVFNLSDLDQLQVQIWAIDQWQLISLPLVKESRLNDIINFITLCLFLYLFNQISLINIDKFDM